MLNQSQDPFEYGPRVPWGKFAVNDYATHQLSFVEQKDKNLILVHL